MTESQHTPDQASLDFAAGDRDGYYGHVNSGGSSHYHAGYDNGAARWHTEQAQEQEAEQEWNEFYAENRAAYWDDDPSPYHGDYSEM